MNEMQKDNFDMLISAAVVQCVHHDADNLSSVDTSDVPDTSRLYKKVMRNLPGSRRTAVKAIVTLVLAAALLALTACACLPEIRDYVWGVVTEWYGDHFEVSFEQKLSNEIDNNNVSSENATPTSIEQIGTLSYLPSDCYKGDEFVAVSQYYVDFYISDEWAFSFTQHIHDVSNSFMDGEQTTPVYVQVNGNVGILTEENIDGTVYYSLLWKDNMYTYNIQGSFLSISELIKIAEGTTLE